MAPRHPAHSLLRLPARAEHGFHVVVESPRGSTVKWKYEPQLAAFSISRPLAHGLEYPFDWGFVPSTRAPDGDPLDVMVLWEQPGFPGVVLPCRAIGALKVEQKAKEGRGRERNDRLIAVPLASARRADLTDVTDLSTRERRELEAFFVAAVQFQDKHLKLLGWAGPEEAEAILEQAIRAAKRRR